MINFVNFNNDKKSQKKSCVTQIGQGQTQTVFSIFSKRFQKNAEKLSKWILNMEDLELVNHKMTINELTTMYTSDGTPRMVLVDMKLAAKLMATGKMAKFRPPTK